MRLLQNKEINSLNDIVAVILWQIRPGKTRKVDEIPLQGLFFFHLLFLSVFAYKIPSNSSNFPLFVFYMIDFEPGSDLLDRANG
jgi:hypothetical protein